MELGLIEAMGFFGIVLVLAVIELMRTRALLRASARARGQDADL